MRKLRLAKYIGAFYLAVIVTVGFIMPATAQASQASRCTEDMSCFNWATMGNHQRGVKVWQGGIVVTKVVGPCRFARLSHAKRIDSTSVRLNGDKWAREHGCATR